MGKVNVGDISWKITDVNFKTLNKIEQYAENPMALQNQVKKLTNSIYFRFKVGNYRVIFF